MNVHVYIYVYIPIVRYMNKYTHVTYVYMCIYKKGTDMEKARERERAREREQVLNALALASEASS